jgi:hypothetical protein
MYLLHRPQIKGIFANDLANVETLCHNRLKPTQSCKRLTTVQWNLKRVSNWVGSSRRSEVRRSSAARFLTLLRPFWFNGLHGEARVVISYRVSKSVGKSWAPPNFKFTHCRNTNSANRLFRSARIHIISWIELDQLDQMDRA